MGKKCVQLVGCVWALLWGTFVYAQKSLAACLRVGKNSTLYAELTQEIHNRVLQIYLWFKQFFYTVSTVPIITTIFIYNKEQLRVAKELV